MRNATTFKKIPAEQIVNSPTDITPQKAFHGKRQLGQWVRGRIKMYWDQTAEELGLNEENLPTGYQYFLPRDFKFSRGKQSAA